MNDFFKLLLILGSSFLLCFFFCRFHLRHFELHPQDRKEVSALQKTHQFKSCGGICFILATLIVFVLFNKNHLMNRTAVSLIFTLLYFGLIGFLDDLIKIVFKNSDGLSGYLRLFLEMIGVLILIYVNKYTRFLFINVHLFHLSIYIGGFCILYVLLCVLGTTNAVNFSDGLDCLSSGLIILALTPYLFLAIRQQNEIIASFIMALIGSLMAYLVFNFHPSKLIMGDVGSLSVGSIIAVIGLLMEYEWLILISGFVFILEILSVVLQVGYFKMTGGKRIFKMTPLHYHFLKSGMSESNVVILFYLVGLIFSIIAIVGVMV